MGPASSAGQSAAGMREIAWIAAVRSVPSPLTNVASALNVSASLPRTDVSAIIAARRTAPRARSRRPRSSTCSRRAGRLSASKTTLRPRVEHLESEAVEPLAEVAVGAVVNDDRVDRVLGAEVDLPPGVRCVLLGVGLAAVAVGAALVAVDGRAGVAAVGGVLLRGLALRGRRSGRR